MGNLYFKTDKNENYYLPVDNCPNHLVYDYQELKESFINVLEGNGEYDSSHAALRDVRKHTTENINEYKNKVEAQGGGWSGGTAWDMSQWLIHGYKERLTKYEGDLFVKNDKRSFFFDEEGELDVPLAYSGHDYPYLNQHPRKRKPGIKIIFASSFSNYVPNNYIKGYSSAIGKLVHTLEQNGYDVEAVARYPINGMLNGEPLVLDVGLTYKDQITNIEDWDAILSPAGFRKFVFACFDLCGVRTNKTVNYYYGVPLANPNGDIIYNFHAESRELYIYPNGQTNEKAFKEKELLEAIKNEGIL